MGAPWSRRIGSPTPSASAGTTSPSTVCLHACRPAACARASCSCSLWASPAGLKKGRHECAPVMIVRVRGCGGCRANLARHLWQRHALWRLPPHNAHRGEAVWLRPALRAPRPQPQRPGCVPAPARIPVRMCFVRACVLAGSTGALQCLFAHTRLGLGVSSHVRYVRALVCACPGVCVDVRALFLCGVSMCAFRARKIRA